VQVATDLDETGRVGNGSQYLAMTNRITMAGTGRLTWVGTGAAVLVATLWIARGGVDLGEQAEDSDTPPGSYEGLSFWGDSRAYPGVDIPDGGFSRAYEYSKTRLRDSVSTDPFGVTGVQALGAAWEPLGPTNGGGRTLTVVFEPGDPGTIWAGAAGGGLWRSTTGGVGATAWERIDTGFPVLGVSSIAFDPGDANVIYIGTGEVYNHQMSGDLPADRRTRGSYGIGILKSTDGGGTWSKSLDWSYNQKHGVWAVRVDPLDADVVWAATTDGIYKSVDAGASWVQKLNVVMGTDLVIHPTSTDTVLAACGNLSSANRGIYRSTDGGDNWNQTTGGGIPSSFMGKIQFAVTPADPDLVFASIGNGFTSAQGQTWLMRSTDFGDSFNLRSNVDYSRYQGWFAHDVAVSPTDVDTLMCIGIDAWKSTNGGMSLTQKSDWASYFTGAIPSGGPEGPPNFSHADHHDVIYHPTDPNILYLANDGGVFRSTDGGETFEGVNGGYQTQQFYNGSTNYATDPNLAMGGLQDNSTTIYRGSGDWDRGVLGGDGGWGAIDPTDSSIVYATAQFLYIAKSVNDGVNFTYIAPSNPGGPVAFISPFLISQEDPQVLYGGTSYMHRSFDGGNSWDLGNGGAELDGNGLLLLAIAQDNDDVIYAATYPGASRGHVFRSLDGGASFTDITGSLPDRYPGDLTVDPADEATVILTMSGFGSSHAYRSTDYGTTWADIDGGVLPDVPTSAVVVDPQNPDHIYVGNDIGVYVTRNGGSTWVQLHLGLSEAVMVMDLGISSSDRRLRAFTHGQGCFETDLVRPPTGRRFSTPPVYIGPGPP
jgi:hypothetical protein